MKQVIGNFINPLSQAIYEFVAVIPMGVVRGIIFVILGLLALWVIMMPPQLPEKCHGEKTLMVKDLRLFALLVLVIQAALYIIF